MLERISEACYGDSFTMLQAVMTARIAMETYYWPIQVAYCTQY
jgi:hypothetical protein